MSRILKTIQKIIKGAYTGSISELKNTKNGVKKGEIQLGNPICERMDFKING
ncbi:MAG TPA: hypothetical protein IAC14_10950 [Candidatus Scybalomonas excrementigallinarum]|nr:hypothetical protein [Candidatus Scybalomonas excrementigallinarum]